MRQHAAVLFDLDGVVTDTAGIHASTWKRMFDEYLRGRAERCPGAPARHRGPQARSCRPRWRGRSHALGRPDGRAARRVDLAVVVQFDDLGGLEEGSGQFGKAHHQHGADREVGGDDHVGGRKPAGDLGVIVSFDETIVLGYWWRNEMAFWRSIAAW